MRARGIDPRWPPTQHVLNWAAWHRVHAWDPQWEQHVIRGNGPSTHDYARWLGWEQGDKRWRVSVLDTTQADIDQLLQVVARWAMIERGSVQFLSPGTNWWA